MNYLLNFSLLSYILLALSIILLWIKQINKKTHLCLIVTALLFAIISKIVTPLGILSIITLLLLINSINLLEKTKLLSSKKSIIYLVHSMFTIFAILMFFHLIPGFNNLKILLNKKFCQICAPYNLYFNFDIAIVGYLMLSYWNNRATKRSDWLVIFKVVIPTFIMCTLILMGTSYFLRYICLSPKLPTETLFWAGNNLLFVCTTEEAFFRGYIQKYLMSYFNKYNLSIWFAIIITSVLFGLRHIKGGSNYVVLSAIAGIFYGYAYAKSNCRIEASILTHFGLNTAHFLLFSYPFRIMNN